MTKEHEDMPMLTDADANMLDRLVDAEFDPSKITGLDGGDQARLERIISILGLLDSYPVAELTGEDRTTLVNATLARIDRAESEQADRMHFEPGSSPVSRMGVPELIAVAAIIILGLSIIFLFLTFGFCCFGLGFRLSIIYCEGFGLQLIRPQMMLIQKFIP